MFCLNCKSRCILHFRLEQQLTSNTLSDSFLCASLCFSSWMFTVSILVMYIEEAKECNSFVNKVFHRICFLFLLFLMNKQFSSNQTFKIKFKVMWYIALLLQNQDWDFDEPIRLHQIKKLHKTKSEFLMVTFTPCFTPDLLIKNLLSKPEKDPFSAILKSRQRLGALPNRKVA